MAFGAFGTILVHLPRYYKGTLEIPMASKALNSSFCMPREVFKDDIGHKKDGPFLVPFPYHA